MPTLDVTNVRVVSFAVDTLVTAPDSNTYLAIANLRYGVQKNVNSLTVNQVDPVMCQLKGAYSIFSGHLFQVFTVDEVRTPV